MPGDCGTICPYDHACQGACCLPIAIHSCPISGAPPPGCDPGHTPLSSLHPRQDGVPEGAPGQGLATGECRALHSSHGALGGCGPPEPARMRSPGQALALAP